MQQPLVPLGLWDLPVVQIVLSGYYTDAKPTAFLLLWAVSINADNSMSEI